MGTQKSNLPDSHIEYPVGSFIRTEAGYFYLKSESSRLRIPSERILDSWSPQRIIETTEAAVSRYRVSAKLLFRNGSLIYNIADGKVYLIEKGKRRHITSPEAYARLGIDHKRLRKYVTVCSLDEINMHDEGENYS